MRSTQRANLWVKREYQAERRHRHTEDGSGGCNRCSCSNRGKRWRRDRDQEQITHAADGGDPSEVTR